MHVTHTWFLGLHMWDQSLPFQKQVQVAPMMEKTTLQPLQLFLDLHQGGWVVQAKELMNQVVQFGIPPSATRSLHSSSPQAHVFEPLMCYNFLPNFRYLCLGLQCFIQVVGGLPIKTNPSQITSLLLTTKYAYCFTHMAFLSQNIKTKKHPPLL